MFITFIGVERSWSSTLQGHLEGVLVFYIPALPAINVTFQGCEQRQIYVDFPRSPIGHAMTA